LPPSQWRSARTTNAIERLHEEFKRRIKTQTVLPSADIADMLFWSVVASGQISMSKVNSWQSARFRGHRNICVEGAHDGKTRPPEFGVRMVELVHGAGPLFR